MTLHETGSTTLGPYGRHRAGLLPMLGSGWRHRELVAALVRREVVGRYRGSWIGLAWSFFNPLLMLAVYTFVFSVVFKTRWGVALEEESSGGFALILFVGIIVHGVLAECLNRGPTLVLSNAAYVKRVIFPLEILPWVGLGSAMFHAAISTLVLLCAQIVLAHSVPWTVVLLPVVMAPYALLMLGLMWMLAATGVYIRDIAQLTGIIATALLFLAPVMYPASAIPAEYRDLLYLNPVSLIVEQARQVMIVGALPDWAALGRYTLVAFVVAWIGFWWFQRTRKGFADVL